MNIEELEAREEERRKQIALRQAARYLEQQARGERSDDRAARALRQSPDYEEIRDAIARAFGREV